MKKIIMIGLLLMVPRAMCGQSGKVNQHTARPSPQKVELPRPSPAVVAEQNRIRRLMGPKTKQVIHQMAPVLQNRVMRLPATANFKQLATSEVRKQFPNVSPQALDVLSFALLSEVADNMRAERLQMMMDRQSKILSTLSGLLQSMGTTKDDPVVGNIKD